MKFSTNKKGQESGGGYSTAVWLALILISIPVLYILIQKSEVFASQLSEETACYTSIVGSRYSSGESEARCPITNYIIYNDKIMQVKEEKETQSTIIKDFSANDDKTRELFAKMMGNCLQKGGGINSKAFSRNWFSSSTVCLECSNVAFDKSVGKESFGDLREFLEKTSIPDKSKKYADALTRDTNKKNDWIDYGQQKDIIPGKYDSLIQKNKIYTIFFIGIKLGTATNLATGTPFGDDTYFVYTATQQNFNKICDRKVN